MDTSLGYMATTLWPRPWAVCRICRRARGHAPGPAACFRLPVEPDPRLGTPGDCDARIGFDDRQRRAIGCGEYIEMKRGGAWYLIGPGTVRVERIRYRGG